MAKPGSIKFLYQEVKNGLSKQRPRRRSAKQQVKKTIVLKKVNIDEADLPPCVHELMARVLNGDSIGFNGRNMLIGKMQYHGVPNDQIVSIFLQNGDAERYDVLEPCSEFETGYRLRDSFDLIRIGIHPRCDSIREFCSYAECQHRHGYDSHHENATAERPDAPSFAEYREEAQFKLEEIFDDFFKEK